MGRFEIYGETFFNIFFFFFKFSIAFIESTRLNNTNSNKIVGSFFSADDLRIKTQRTKSYFSLVAQANLSICRIPIN